MTEPSNLRDAAEVTVTEADQSAAEAWLNANNGEWIDALNLAEAFARHRQAAIKERDAEIVAWLRVREGDYRMSGQGGYATVLDLVADAIERGEA